MQPLKEIEAAVIGDFVPVESIEVGLGVVCECVAYKYVHCDTKKRRMKRNKSTSPTHTRHAAANNTYTIVGHWMPSLTGLKELYQLSPHT